MFALLSVNSVGCLYSFCYFRCGVAVVDAYLLVTFAFGCVGDFCGFCLTCVLVCLSFDISL